VLGYDTCDFDIWMTRNVTACLDTDAEIIGECGNRKYRFSARDRKKCTLHAGIKKTRALLLHTEG